MPTQLITDSKGPWLIRNFFIFLALYFSAHIVLRLVSSPALELDEAEQILLSQWLLPSYSTHPPLYTWLQFVFIKVFGIGVLPLSLLKNMLLFTMYLFLYLGARKVIQEPSLAIIAASSLFFIPQISWTAQKDLTHTVLLLAASSAFFYATLVILEKRSLKAYALFGLTMGVGALSKPNFLIFAAALIFSCLTLRKYRSRLIHPRVLISFSIALLISSLYLYWLIYNNLFTGASVTASQISISYGLVKMPFSLLYSIGVILLPMIALFAIILPQGFRGANNNAQSSTYSKLLSRFFIILLVLLVFLVLAFQIEKLKNRWLAPLFILLPIYYVSRIDLRAVPEARVKLFSKTVIAIAAIILLTMIIRNLGCPVTGRESDFNFPSAELANQMKNAGFKNGTIIAEDRLLAGSLKIQFPNSLALCPELSFLEPNHLNHHKQVIILWRGSKSKAVPIPLKSYILNTLGLPINITSIHHEEIPLHFCPNKTTKINMALMSP